MDRNFLTFDTDWCPDWAIEELANVLVKKNISSSWFITNDFPILKDLSRNPLFDIGIHPNFFQGSSHGKDIHEVLKFLKKLVPDACIVRSHSLYSSERHLQIMVEEFGITHDCSQYVHGISSVFSHKLRYSDQGKELIRAPHFFQDNMYLMNRKDSFSLSSNFFKTTGLRIFNFHPIHCLLNSENVERYLNLKHSGIEMNKVTKEQMNKFSNSSIGIRTLFNEVLDNMTEVGSFKITDIK